jgi:hypothetical protein
MPEPNFQKLGMYIMASDPISTAYFINPSHQTVYPPMLLSNGSIDTFPRQQLHTIIKELLEAWFSMRSVFYQRRVYGYVYVSLARVEEGLNTSTVAL